MMPLFLSLAMAQHAWQARRQGRFFTVMQQKRRSLILTEHVPARGKPLARGYQHLDPRSLTI